MNMPRRFDAMCGPALGCVIPRRGAGRLDPRRRESNEPARFPRTMLW
jgi:hypothetical protein